MAGCTAGVHLSAPFHSAPILFGLALHHRCRRITSTVVDMDSPPSYHCNPFHSRRHDFANAAIAASRFAA
jgi:hypothetical protein